MPYNTYLPLSSAVHQVIFSGFKISSAFDCVGFKCGVIFINQGISFNFHMFPAALHPFWKTKTFLSIEMAKTVINIRDNEKCNSDSLRFLGIR